MNKINKILWFTWKDRTNPHSGGAEAVNEEIAKRLAAKGYKIIFIVSGFPGAKAREEISGYQVIRLGTRWTVYWQAYKYYKKHLAGWADLVIDEINTVPFFCKFYVREPNIVLAYQLCREIWFHQIYFPLNLLGYLLEPIYLRLLNNRYVLTESMSAKVDLQKYGYQADKIFIFPIGLEQPPLSAEAFKQQQKESAPTILYFGSLRRMKRPDQVLEVFFLAKNKIPGLKFWLAGAGESHYSRRILAQIKNSPYASDIIYHGRVNDSEKLKLMGRAQLLAAASIKEGWGIVVTEANSQGTPAVVYDVDGLRDSCHDGITGLVAKNNSPADLAEKITTLLNDPELYQSYRQRAWQDSQDYNYDKSTEIFLKALNEISARL